MTKSQRDRLGGLFAKFSEILFWLVAVGPFIAKDSIGLGAWLVAVGLMVVFLISAVVVSKSKEEKP